MEETVKNCMAKALSVKDSDSDSDRTALASSRSSSPSSPCVWTSANATTGVWLKRAPSGATIPATANAVTPQENASPSASVSPDKAPAADADTAAPFVASTRRAESLSHSGQGSSTMQARPLVPRRELLLSPASQLDVLSQISELAESQARQSAVRPTSSSTTNPKKRPHMWAPASHQTRRKRRINSAICNVSEGSAGREPTKLKPKPKPETQKRNQASTSRIEKLAADMLDWETCSEDFFDSEEGQGDWKYENISDDDFE